MKNSLSIFFLVLISQVAVFAQTPVIQNIEPATTYPNDTITIAGSGFSSTIANLEVWFGAVKGTIVTSSEFAIRVIVPAQAKATNITVLNKTSLLSAQSPDKFFPSFAGAAFNINNFSSALTFGAEEELWDLNTTDLNSDGKPEIIATKFASAGLFKTSSDFIILKNQSTPGALSFTKLDKINLPVLGVNFPTDNVIAGDLQGDGKPDLILCRGGSTRNSIHILRNTSTGTDISFAGQVALALDAQNVATRISLRDLNRDGKPEIIVSNTFNENVYIFINQSSGANITFNTTPIKLSVRVFATDQSSNNYEVEVQDFNGDNLPDMIVNEFQEDSLHIFKNTSTSAISFAARVTIPTVERLNRLSSADVNNDGKLDLIVTSTLQNKLLVFLNTSSLTTISFNPTPISLTTLLGAWGVDVGDIDGDKFPDIVTTNRDESGLSIFRHNGNFAAPAFTKTDLTTANKTRNIKVDDMDGDGKPDLIYTSFNALVAPSTSTVEIRRNLNCHQPDILNDNETSVVVCNGQTIALQTIPANNVTYQWTKNGANVGLNEPSLEITSPGAAGDYVVTATGESGACVIASATVSVTEDTGAAPANPVLNAASAVCSGTNLQLSTNAVSGAEYIWRGPNNFTSDLQNPIINNVTPNNTGEYSLQVKVDVCKSYETTKLIDVADLADFTISSNHTTNIICAGQSVTLSVSSLTGYSYQWKKDGADVLINGTNASLVVTQDGAYSVTVTNIALDCSKDIGPTTVTVYSSPSASFTAPLTACSTQEIQFTNTSQSDARATVTYAWDFKDATTSTEFSPTKIYTIGQAISPSLTIQYVGLTGCSALVANPLTVFTSVLPVINSTATSLCPEEELTLSITGTYNSITWTPAGTTNSITAVGPGTYSVVTSDANNCPGSDELILDAKEVPLVSLSAEPAIIVAGSSSQLTATSTNATANTYLWTPAESLDDATIANPLASPEQTTTYGLTTTSVDGCIDEQEITVTVSGILTFPLSFSPNGDGINEEWNIRAQDKPDCTLSIFDGRGRRVFESKGQNWDGSYGGQTVPTGTYYYVFGCPDESPVTGHILVVR